MKVTIIEKPSGRTYETGSFLALKAPTVGHALKKFSIRIPPGGRCLVNGTQIPINGAEFSREIRDGDEIVVEDTVIMNVRPRPADDRSFTVSFQ